LLAIPEAGCARAQFVR